MVEVWQACDFKQLYIYPGCDAGIRAMDLSHDQRYTETQGRDSMLKLENLAFTAKGLCECYKLNGLAEVLKGLN